MSCMQPPPNSPGTCATRPIPPHPYPLPPNISLPDHSVSVAAGS